MSSSSTVAYWPASPIIDRIARALAMTSSPATLARPLSGLSRVESTRTRVGLSGSVRSEQGEHPARLYRQGDLVEGAGSTEPFGERFYLDHPGRWRVASYGTDQFRSGKYDARSRAVPEIGISARTTAAVQQAAARAPGR